MGGKPNHTGGRPPKYAYPEVLGAVAINLAANRQQAKRIMSCASKRAAYFGLVYRCRSEGERVMIQRVA